jgi:hypothetical protein
MGFRLPQNDIYDPQNRFDRLIDRCICWFPMEASIHEDLLCMWAIATFWLGVDKIVISLNKI